ncbi:vWA domain-containing protein [Acidipropionibacterium jensenii]|uniref:von Willebrand factor type A domain n=1 Tax=Acidipropionibacterium jensenii TaxID=1749 RepID=A0A3S4UY34_9ACTN|nr:VWA domain-containing protein [Acidipropionibacterium jensenii]MDN5976370.1 VWA domain-containing protein [Acidipropionibacterium jensenii]MDN5995602.1 VWA domain-containing protein [Acidipropionibacterium jensenii]MDN6425656.1 VWA domain-containing protein [Acidipropionibacterium jensenii]MDN6440568.1 VWA domain-containing protein [Acidipropionibacterium jensenii]MDN6479436.1 VWA domain-containing protein [Acidipropionibacterium jensenii]
MGLKYWYLGLAVTLAMVTVAVIRHVRAGRANLSPAGFPVAHTDRVKVLPRYRHLVRMQLRWLLVEAISLGLACLGVAIVVSRPAWVNIDSREMRNRDVMLCLDVSGSMSQTDAAVISSYQDLVGRLHGERIGFTVFDSAAATVFPLTDDYAFISDQLTETLKAMRTNQTTPVLEATRVGDRGASLIGDGLASCLQGFDRMGEARSRTVVLTTDNDLSGTPLFTLSEAADRAEREHILVYGVTPSWADQAKRADFKAEATRTGGQVLTLNTADPGTNLEISHGIERSQRQALLTMPIARSFDQPWPGALLMLLGLAGMMLAAWGTRS